MPRFSANLTFLFTEVPFMERFQAAETFGFAAVEYMFPYEHDLDEIASELERLQLHQVLFNFPAGNWAKGDRGIAADPERTKEFRDGVGLALTAAQRLECPMVNCLAGLRNPEIPHHEQWRTLAGNLRFAAKEASEFGVTVLVEAVNTYDIPGFFLTRSSEVVRLLDEVSAPNLKIQHDLYHAQRMEGNLVPTLRELLPRIGHVQIADPPERHQPGTGELNFTYILEALDEAGYTGHVGLEYRPLGPTVDSLLWIESMGFSLDRTGLD
jgi:hydroxypyruvate isomerase